MSDDPTDPPPPPRRRHLGRKLLIAAVGVATISYVACNSTTTSGNLVAPPEDAQVDSGTDASADAPDTAAADVALDRMAMSGNLIAPPPDAGPDGAD